MFICDLLGEKVPKVGWQITELHSSKQNTGSLMKKNWFCCFLPPHFGYLFSQQVTFSDIRNCYFGYPKYLFRISEISIPDIRNYAKKAFYLRYPKKVILDIQSNNFGYPKINIYFGYQRLLFWIFEIVISDIWNFFRYLKLMCQYFRYHKFFFGYPE